MTSDHKEMSYLMTKTELRELICDLCGKFSSIKPMKSYFVPKGRCARCIDTESADDVVSLKLRVDKHVFPCFNIYDGCKKLLKPDEVVEHEANCKSTECFCPLCKYEAIPLYKLPKHYEEKHKGNYLRSRIFLVDLREYIKRRWYLYEQSTRLFYIQIERNEIGTYSIFAEYLGAGDVNQVITQQFSVCFGHQKHITKEMECYSELSTDVDTLEALNFGCDKEIVVSFSLDIPLYRGFTTSQDGVVTKMSASRIVSDWDYPESYLIQPRKIFLPRIMQQRFVTWPNTTLDYFTAFDGTKYFPYCYHCGELSYTTYRTSTGNNVFFYTVGKNEYLFCSYCLWLPNPEPLRISKVQLQESYYECLRYCCIWNCIFMGGYKDIEKHHVECEKQPSRLCPKQYCQFEGKLYELKEHFSREHPEICLSLSSSVLVSFSESSPDEYILLVRDAFVRLELKVHEDVFRAKFSLCSDGHRFGNKRLRALASDELTKIYVGSCVYPEELLLVKARDSLRICCYFELNEQNLPSFCIADGLL